MYLYPEGLIVDLCKMLQLWRGYFDIIDEEDGSILCSSEDDKIFRELLHCPVQSAHLIYDCETNSHRMAIKVIIPI